MKIIIKCGEYNENMYIHGTESNILDMCRVIIIILDTVYRMKIIKCGLSSRVKAFAVKVGEFVHG